MVLMTEMTAEQKRWALTGLAQNPTIRVDERLKIYLQVINELEGLVATCSCSTGSQYEGPEADCPVHGAVRALNEVAAENQKLRSQVAWLKARLVEIKDLANEEPFSG